MAEAVIYDVCRKAFKPAETKHIRVHQSTSGNSYSSKCLKNFDVCPTCYKKILDLLDGGGK